MKYGFLTWRNAGFKRNEGTINQLVYLTNTIYQNLNEGKDTAMFFFMQVRLLTAYGMKAYYGN